MRQGYLFHLSNTLFNNKVNRILKCVNVFFRFSVKSVQTNRSEMFAVTTSFIECLRYSVLLNVKNRDLCIALLKEQVLIL